MLRSEPQDLRSVTAGERTQLHDERLNGSSLELLECLRQLLYLGHELRNQLDVHSSGGGPHGFDFHWRGCVVKGEPGDTFGARHDLLYQLQSLASKIGRD